MLRTLILVVGLGACAPGAEPQIGDTTPPASVVTDTLRMLVTLQQSGWDAPVTLIIDDSTAFASAWAVAHAGLTPVPAFPPVDLSRERVIVVAAGMRSSGGYGLSASVAPTAGADVVIQSPGPGCGATAQITHPAIIFTMRRTSQRPKVAVSERAGPPC